MTKRTMLSLLPSASHMGQGGTTKSSYETLSSNATWTGECGQLATAQSSNNGSTHITIGICLGLCARALELGEKRAPARVRLSKPLLKHRTGVDVAMLAVYFLCLAISRCLLPSKQEKRIFEGNVCRGRKGGNSKWDLQRCSRVAQECVGLLRVQIRCGGALRGAGHRHSGL